MCRTTEEHMNKMYPLTGLEWEGSPGPAQAHLSIPISCAFGLERAPPYTAIPM